ncbi:protein SMAX1-LIKE 2-like [Curcuma longa]|uniref:protein SMAX1-LIKE 2-like n=1 Tax=Curcuma longa TaxID=136217 RepID=UPI003D9F975D
MGDSATRGLNGRFRDEEAEWAIRLRESRMGDSATKGPMGAEWAIRRRRGPVDFAPIRQRAAEAISKSFAAAVEEKWSVKIDEEAIDLVVGVLWIAAGGFEEWCEKVLTPLCKELKGRLIVAAGRAAIARLIVVENSETRAQMWSLEVVSVLARSAAKAAQRKHGQTTPLHVAATLFADPSGLLRQYCLSCQPDSKADGCRALELCFSIALDRLPSDGGQASAHSPLSNSLKAALEGAQASQRRGWPEHPQQLAAPLLAVRVEIKQLIISILEDPQVSRVMWDAGFSSAAVKAVVEQSLSSSSSNYSSTSTSSTITAVPVRLLTTTTSPVSPVPSVPAHLSETPRLPNGSGAAGAGDGEQQRTEEMKRVMSTLSSFKKRNPIVVGDLDPQAVTKAVIQTIESGLAPPPLHTAKVVSFAKELYTATISGNKSWIVAKIGELGNIIQLHAIGGVVVDIGDLKCLVESLDRPPTTTSSWINAQLTAWETAWAAVAEMARLLKAFREGGIQVWLLGTATYTTYVRCQIYHPTMDDDWDLQAVYIAQSSQISPRIGTQQFPEILPSSTRTGMCAVCAESYSHDIAKATNHLLPKETLLKKWQEVCCRLHSNVPSPPSAASLPETSVKEPKKVEFLNQQKTSFADAVDDETFKKLYKCLLDKVSWQPEAASATAIALLRPKPGNRRGHTWLLYLGPDKIGKRKMATAISELVFRAPPVVVKLSDTDCEKEGECTVRFRGWTSMDRLVEAIRKNPSSVVLIEEFDRTDDLMVRRSIKRAMEQGTMVDSYGQEVSLGSVVFVLTSNWLPEQFKRSYESLIQCEGKALRAVERRRLLNLSLCLNLAFGTAAEADSSEGSSNVTVERNVSKGRLAVSANEDSTLFMPELVQLVDGAVVFTPVDFAAIRRRATEAISKSFAAAVGERWSISIDKEAIDLVAGNLWIAADGFEEWCEKVVTPLCKELESRLIAAGSAAIARLSVVENSGTRAVGGGGGGGGGGDRV